MLATLAIFVDRIDNYVEQSGSRLFNVTSSHDQRSLPTITKPVLPDPPEDSGSPLQGNTFHSTSTFEDINIVGAVTVPDVA